jgi:alpha-L-rhamnosidase
MDKTILRRDVPPKIIKPALILLVGMVVFFLPSCGLTPTEPSQLQPPSQPGTTNPELSGQPAGDITPFASVTPIWAEDPDPSSTNDIVLCRFHFSNQDATGEFDLEIFADTRYEVWIDGLWVGRGPARFSKTLREYDIYSLDGVTPGDHLAAVLAQWAPSVRRSETTTPYIKARILGSDTSGVKVLAATSPAWRCLRSGAWRPDAAAVHEWGLIGPTELLDFRRLPQNWNQPDFQDADWPEAVVAVTGDGTALHYQPRSIPMLVNTRVPIEILATGTISPGSVIGEIPAELPLPHTITITATKPTSATFEILAGDKSETLPTEVVQIDDFKPDWSPVGALRPDVQQASFQLDAGAHRIVFSDALAGGVTFAISKQNLDLQEISLDQGNHAGRRSLLAQLSPDPGGARITESDGHLDLKFDSPPAYAVLDLGRTVHGRLTAEANGPPGAIIDIGWDERLSAGAHRPLPYPGSLHPQWNQVDSWIMDGITRTLTTIDARAGRYILIIAWGNGPIDLKDIRVYEEHYPATQVGSFHSSDPLLDRVWQTGVNSLIPTMLDAYVDTPWRERGQWWGDAYVANRINQVAFGDVQLIQRAITYMADSMITEPAPGLAPSNHGHHMLDYAMLWVHGQAEIIQNMPVQSGRALATDNFTALTQLMAHLEGFENSETGLLDLPDNHWSQNAYIDTYGSHSRTGQSTALNALYYGTLLQAAHIADLVNDPTSGEAWLGKADQLKQNIHETLFLPSQHRYLSSIHAGQPIKPSPHAQAWPLVYDIVPEEEVPFVADALLELISADPKKPNINVYGMYWVLEALGKSGKIEQSLEVIRQYYGYMLAQGATTWWEVFSIYPNQNQSLSHGWGGAPTTFLSRYLLGIRQSGRNEWLIQPAFEGVDQASGTIPIQNSALHVKWEIRSCSKMTVNLRSSNTTGGFVVLSFEPSQTIRLDRALIWHHNKPLSEVVAREASDIKIAISGGQHEISIDRNCKVRE